MATKCMEINGGTRNAAGTKRPSGGACGLKTFLRSGRGILEEAVGHLVSMRADAYSGVVELDGVRYEVEITRRVVR